MKTLPRFLPVLTLLTLTALARRANNIDAITDYDPGLNDPLNSGAYQLTGNPAIGLPATTDGFGTDVTPFTPAFATTDLTEINSGGHITLHFANPIITTPGPQVGIYGNIGIVAAFDPNTGAITASSSTFAANPSLAIVSVSATGLPGSFVTLFSGTAIPIDNPTSAFSDSQIAYDPTFQYVSADSGTTPNNFFQPFTGSLSDFTGETYAQMNATLDGAAGGTWLDISSSGLPQVNYIRFDVPTGDTIVLDAVLAVPEPSSLGLFIITLIALARRKQR